MQHDSGKTTPIHANRRDADTRQHILRRKPWETQDTALVKRRRGSPRLT
jgi:hypothetical protein